MSCCGGCNVFDFGHFSCGDCIELPLEAVQAGQHIFYANFRGKIYSVKGIFDIGEPLKFANILNEDALINFQILQPDGCALEYTINECDETQTIYKHFRLTTGIFFEVDQDEVTAQEICGSELAEDGSTIKICSTF